MGDDALSELEAKFHETGAVEDEAAWLTARIEAGELNELRVKLAGVYGLHEAAKQAAPVGGPWSLPDVQEDPEVAARFGVAVARALLADWEREHPPQPEAPSLRATLEAAEAWCCAPGDEAAAQVAASVPEEAADWWAALAALVSDPMGFDTFFKETAAAADALGHEDVRGLFTQAVQQDLVPWLLGAGDPVRERVG